MVKLVTDLIVHLLQDHVVVLFCMCNGWFSLYLISRYINKGFWSFFCVAVTPAVALHDLWLKKPRLSLVSKKILVICMG